MANGLAAVEFFRRMGMGLLATAARARRLCRASLRHAAEPGSHERGDAPCRTSRGVRVGPNPPSVKSSTGTGPRGLLSEGWRLDSVRDRSRRRRVSSRRVSESGGTSARVRVRVPVKAEPRRATREMRYGELAVSYPESGHEGRETLILGDQCRAPSFAWVEETLATGLPTRRLLLIGEGLWGPRGGPPPRS